MKKDNQPIVLSGRVYLDKLLAAEHPGHALPSRVQRGDLKVIALTAQDGPRQLKGKPRQFKRPMPTEPYNGYFSAYVFDGNGWRKFAIRAEAGVPATYASPGERRSRALKLVEALKGLRNASAIWGLRAFEVHNPVTFGRAVPEIHPVLPPDAKGDVVEESVQDAPAGGVTKTAAAAAEPEFKLEPCPQGGKKKATSKRRKTASKRKPRRRKEDPNQTKMFQ